MTVSCTRPGCERSWARDPVLEVVCPTCHAGVGVRCRRPSEWAVFTTDYGHADRDILADRLGKYGPCPLGICGLDRKPENRQLDLFEGANDEPTAS